MRFILSFKRAVPESPRWLMTKNRHSEAYDVFKKIAVSNKKRFENMTELESLRKRQNPKKPDENSVSPLDVNQRLNEVEEKSDEKPVGKIFSTKIPVLKIF